MVSKAVIPVAGFGTRMLPASKSIPKEMLPIVDRPAIDYVVEEAIAAGISEIILVTHGSKSAIENYFDGHPELEAQLHAKGKTELLKKVRRPLPDGVQVISVRQGPPQGLGHAVWQARRVVGDEPFVVILPDVLVDGGGPGNDPGSNQSNDLARMIQRFQRQGAAQIMVEKVPDELVHKYGIADLDDAPAAGESAPMRGVVEKPNREQAPSNLSVVGRYVLPPEVMALLADTPPGAGGEIQLTDAIATLIGQAPVEAYAMLGRTFDCGSKEGYLEAVLHYSLKHPEIADAARQLIASASR